MRKKGEMMGTSNKKQSKWQALIGISISGFLGCLDLTIVNTALPAIQTNFKISVTELQWVITILLIALTTFMVIAGKLADLYGRRLCLYIGMGLFAFSSLGAGLSPNIYFLVAFRFIQGLSIAFLYTAPVALIPSLFPEHERGRATGLLIGANGLGLAMGPMVGGFIVSSLGWRWIFFINLPIILISLLFCTGRITETKNENAIKKIDWLGFILLIIALPAGILGLVQGEIWGWTSFETVSLLLVGILGSVLFYFVENGITAPIIEFHLFANRVFLIGLVANFSLAMFYAINFFLIPLYLHYIQGREGYEIGLYLLPATVMVSALSSTTGKIVDQRGPKSVLMVGLLLFFISALIQAHFSLNTPIYIILFAYLIFGIAWACILSPSIIAALSYVSKESTGVAMGTIGTLHNLGGAIGLAVGTLIYNELSKSALLTALKKNNLPAGAWMNQAISNTENAIQIIQQYTHSNMQSAQFIFQNYFLHGYRGAMWLLVFISLFAFFTVMLGLKNVKVKNQESKPVIH